MEGKLMATTYTYTNKSKEPDLKQIHLDVAASLMSDKVIEWCRWDEGNDGLKETLQVVFTNELSDADKTKLDTIVTNNS